MNYSEIIAITKLESLKTRLMEWAIAEDLTIPDVPEWTDKRTTNHPTNLFEGIQQHLFRLGAKKSARIYLLGDRLSNLELWIFHELLKSVGLSGATKATSAPAYQYNQQQLEVA